MSAIERQTEIMELGFNTAFIVDDTDTHNGTWYKLVITEAVVFATLTRVPAYTGDVITGVSFPANHVLYGRFTVIDLTSGSLIAYS